MTGKETRAASKAPCGRHVPWAAVLLLASICGGCTKSEYDVRPVRGVVTIDGRPMTSGRVMFAPVSTGGNINPGKPAFGHIQSDGSYTLTTYTDNDGAVVGKHGVTIYDTSQSPRFTSLTLPARRTVEAISKNVIDFALTIDDVRKFGIKK